MVLLTFLGPVHTEHKIATDVFSEYGQKTKRCNI